jgi:CelD/BcsL family acetyltransferase involved in cellulose biosynthesis
MTLRCPNSFTHPLWTRAITAQLGGAETISIPPTGLDTLTATLRKRRFPIAHFDSWITPLSNSGLPIAATPPAKARVHALLSAVEKPILFRNLPVDHPTTQALVNSAAHAHVFKRWERAVLRLGGTYEDWLQNNFDQKRRKELKRLRNRLAEQGKLESIALAESGDLASFQAAFLMLEAQSWKGRRGTAIANDPRTEQALAQGLASMHKAGHLKFWQINLDGKPIASLFALVDDGEVTLGKIAYAEAFAKFSPGVLVILDATADLLASGAYDLADSNAMPGHPMIDRIWRDRRECIDVLLAGPSTSTAEFKLLSVLLGTRNAAREQLKRIVTRLTGRKTS